MRFHQPLDDLFRTRSHARVLRALAGLPAGLPASGREIGRRSGLSHPTVARSLRDLARQGTVLVHRTFGADRYELNRRHALVKKIIALFDWEDGLLDELVGFLRDQLRQHRPMIAQAFLFGSITRGEEQPDSDIDLALTCEKQHAGEVESLVEDIAVIIRQRYGSRLNATVSPIAHRNNRDASRVWSRISQGGIPILDSGEGGGTHAIRQDRGGSKSRRAAVPRESRGVRYGSGTRR